MELRPGGANETVTDANKRDYVRLYVAHRFTRGAERQWLALQRGLADIIPAQLLRPLSPRDLQPLLAGRADLDPADWKRHTRLKHVTPEAPIVGWFWEIVEEFDAEMRARLLQFVTGSRRVPLAGFRALQVIGIYFLMVECCLFIVMLTGVYFKHVLIIKIYIFFLT